MSFTREDLKGARWSSAVRCIARAEFQALEIQGDEDAHSPLHDAFARGVNAADNWVSQQAILCQEQGKELYREVEVSWGPEGRWTGHADAVITPDEVVMEAYHSVGGVFQEHKGLQAAFYAHKLGPSYRAMLAALDTTDVGIDGGFAVTLYPVDVTGLRERFEDIEARVVAAYLAGAVNFADRAEDSPAGKECEHCAFRGPCWAGYEYPLPEEVPELADLLDRLALAQSNRAHIDAAALEAKQDVYSLRDEIRQYLPTGRVVSAGGVQVKRVETAPRRSFKLGDYLKAGHVMTGPMREFARESDRPGERWYVTRVEP